MSEQPQITTAKISDLLPYANNAREHTDEQVAQVAASIKEFGWTNPLIVHGTTVVAGHARLAAARKLGMTEVPIIDRSDMSEAQWKAYVLADNQLAQNATWNDGLLALELDYLTELDFDLDLIGFPDLDALMGDDEPEEGLTDPDEVPEPPAEAVTQPGDLWIMGDHRLLCGDSTDAESVAYLMDGAKADMVFTDPPYNIDYEAVSDKRDKIKNDNLDDAEFVKFLTAAIPASPIMYVCCSWQNAHLFKQAMGEIGCQPKAMIVWDKVNPAQHLDLYFKQHELIYYYGDFGGQRTVRGDVWQLKRQRNTDHPTMKPVELVQQAISDHSSKVLFDPFLGSGTTLIAAEQLGRKCYGLEIDPIYCDVIVKRWEDFTGKKAELHGG